MKPLQLELANRIKSRLTHSGVMNAAEWAELYRFMPEGNDYSGLWSFNAFPWLRDMHTADGEFFVGQKSAQMGYSETMLNVAFFTLDILRKSVLYVLPNQRPDATDFTNRAFIPAIDASPRLQQIFSGTDNVGHKMVGSANLYIRGSNSRAQLKSVPASMLIFDEYEEHERENTSLAEERSSGQAYRRLWKISTPSAPEVGINELFERSTQDHFFFPCPSCSRMIELKFPDSLVVTSDDPDSPDIFNTHLICYECKATLPHKGKVEMYKKGQQISQKPGSIIRGFHINQLYSCVLEPYNIARLWLLASKSELAEQEFYNSKLGLPHLVAGAQITNEMLEKLIRDYGMVSGCKPEYKVTMGVDVGRHLHVTIVMWDLTEASPIDINAKAKSKLLFAGELDAFEQLDALMTDYNVDFCVIDVAPETRKATEFANRFFGRARVCRYNQNATARSMFAGKDDVQVSVNRTAWLDLTMGRIRNRATIFPNNLPRDFFTHIKAIMRVPKKDTHGNLIYRYVTKGTAADHYAHSLNYAEIALPFAVGGLVYQTIQE